MASRFPLFDSHLDLAHAHWRQLLQKGDHVLDATCGNGHDTLILAQAALEADRGSLIACDIQEAAIEATRLHLKTHLLKEQFTRITFAHVDHQHIASYLGNSRLKLIVFNLGYLPRGDKSLTTMSATTLISVTHLLPYLCSGGVLSLTCYPGHEEGAKEEKALIQWGQELSSDQWSFCYHRWLNRRHSPSLLLVQRKI